MITSIHLINESKNVATKAHDGCDYVTVETCCPHCQEKPLNCFGKTGPTISTDDRAYECVAFSICCDRNVGILRAETDTLFGLSEDNAVLNGRSRVY